MLILSIVNIEKILWDQPLMSKLLGLEDLYAQYKFAVMHRGFDSMRSYTMFRILKTITPKHLEIIANHLGQEVKLEPLDHAIIKDYNLSLNDLDEEKVCGIENFANLFLYRDETNIYIGSWR